MADRQVVPSNTFEQFRVEFNELAGDVGDVALLPSSINGQSVSDVIGGIKQLNDGLANVLFPNVIDLPDSTNANTGRVKFGADDDFQLFHDGTNSKINNSTGELQVNADTIKIKNAASNETILDGTANGAVQLYHDNSVKLASTSTGITVTGNIQASGNISNGSVNLTFPTVGGAISTEGFSIALATALG